MRVTTQVMLDRSELRDRFAEAAREFAASGGRGVAGRSRTRGVLRLGTALLVNQHPGHGCREWHVLPVFDCRAAASCLGALLVAAFLPGDPPEGMAAALSRLD